MLVFATRNVTMLHFGQFVTFWADNDDQKCNNHVTFFFVTFWVDHFGSIEYLSTQNVTTVTFWAVCRCRRCRSKM